MIQQDNTTTSDSLLWSEADRVAAMESFAILDTPREQEFDDIVRLAAEIFSRLRIALQVPAWRIGRKRKRW